MLKYSFQMPIIIITSVLSVLNGSATDIIVEKNMKIVNTVCNILISLVLALNNTFRFEAKSNNFKINAIKFQKLNNQIQAKILEGGINSDFTASIISAYDNISEDVDDVPAHICKKIKLQYKDKHMPTIIDSDPNESNQGRIVSSSIEKIPMSL